MHSTLATADHLHHVHDVAGCPRCTLGATTELPAVGCPRCGTTGAGVFCSKCGEELERKHVVRRALRALFEPFYEYFQHSRWLIHPGELAREVREGHFTVAELIGFWIAAVLIATLFSGLLTTAEGEHLELPILIEAAQALSIMLTTAAVFAPAHLAFRVGHRDVTVRQYLMMVLGVAALLHPWIVVGDILSINFLPGHSKLWTFPFSLTFYAMALAALYRRKLWTTLPILIAYISAIIALAFVVLNAVNRKPIEPAAAVRASPHVR